MVVHKKILRRAELNFWNLAIPLMSESELVRQSAPLVTRVYAQYKQLPANHKTLLWGFSGWALGLAAGVLIGLL